MKKAVYENLYDLFKKVGKRHNFFSIVDDEYRCRDLFHSMIHRIMHIPELQAISEENTNISNEFRFPKDLRNHLYTAFRWAYLDEVKSAEVRRKQASMTPDDESSDSDEDFQAFTFLSREGYFLFERERSDDIYERFDPKLRDAAHEIFSRIKWEKLELVSLRYMEGNKLKDCERFTGIPRETFDRKVKKTVQEIRDLISEILGEVERTEARQVWECLMLKLLEWKESEHE